MNAMYGSPISVSLFSYSRLTDLQAATWVFSSSLSGLPPFFEFSHIVLITTLADCESCIKIRAVVILLID